jgi:hypothetical protein
MLRWSFRWRSTFLMSRPTFFLHCLQTHPKSLLRRAIRLVQWLWAYHDVTVHTEEHTESRGNICYPRAWLKPTIWVCQPPRDDLAQWKCYTTVLRRPAWALGQSGRVRTLGEEAMNLQNVAYCWNPGGKALRRQAQVPRTPGQPPSKRHCSVGCGSRNWRWGSSEGHISSGPRAGPWSPTRTCRGSPAWNAGSSWRQWAWPPAEIRQ